MLIAAFGRADYEPRHQFSPSCCLVYSQGELATSTNSRKSQNKRGQDAQGQLQPSLTTTTLAFTLYLCAIFTPSSLNRLKKVAASSACRRFRRSSRRPIARPWPWLKMRSLWSSTADANAASRSGSESTNPCGPSCRSRHQRVACLDRAPDDPGIDAALAAALPPVLDPARHYRQRPPLKQLRAPSLQGQNFYGLQWTSEARSPTSLMRAGISSPP